MKKLILMTLLFSPLTQAVEKTYGDVTITEVGTIYDGDTFYVTIHDWPKIVGEHIAVRVNGVDTPEMKGECKKEIKLARDAKRFTVEFLRNAKSIELKNMARDKYFRIDADVYADGKNLAEELIRNGLGYEYHGATKKNWCAK